MIDIEDGQSKKVSFLFSFLLELCYFRKWIVQMEG